MSVCAWFAEQVESELSKQSEARHVLLVMCPYRILVDLLLRQERTALCGLNVSMVLLHTCGACIVLLRGGPSHVPVTSLQTPPGCCG